MKSLLNFMGIILLVIGILTLIYQGITYTKKEEVARIGNIHVTSDTQQTVYFSPLLGGLSIGAGVVLLLIGRIKRK